ncbi:hypothetical protein [Litorimonas sp.]|uniref:hypothetical protein n=1 Tax=Litorimonas sp. TaxID=1892381 RepID=UPI003A883A14
MFMGHYAPAMWAPSDKVGQPYIKLWEGFLAVQAIDLVFAVLVIFGIEDSIVKNGDPVFNIPWSHSLVTSLLISASAAFIFKAFKKVSDRKVFWIIFGLVFSHWVMDFLVHRPDLPLFPLEENVYGLGIWNYPWLAYGLEMGLLLCGFLYWVRRTIAISPMFKFAPWVLFVLMGAAQLVFITLPGLQIAKGTFDSASQLQGTTLGLSCLGAFFGLAACIGWIENGRKMKPVQSSST